MGGRISLISITMPDKQDQIPDYLIKLIDGCNSYIKIASNFWLTLAAFSIIAISPTKTNDSKIEMPLGLGLFEEINFYPLIFIIIALLIMCYGSTMSQALRGRKLIQRVVNNLPSSDKTICKESTHIQDIVDILIHPSLNRVAPLAQIMQGEKQFLPESNTIPVNKKKLYSLYYLFLKLIATLVIYFVPGYALFITFFNSNVHSEGAWGLPTYIFWIFTIIAFLILLQLLILEIEYTFNAYNKIKKKR